MNSEANFFITGGIVSICVALVNLLNSVINIFWTNKLKSIQANKELVDSLIMQNKAKDEVIISKDAVIDDLLEKKNSYKRQIHVQLMDRKKKEGQLEVYQDIHKLGQTTGLERAIE